MRFDVDLHRTTITLHNRLADGRPFELSVIDAGPGSQGDKYAAPTMVFVHGFGGRAAYWEYQLEQFHENYRVIALDLRGHGYSDAPTEDEGARYDVPELVADLEEALQILRVPERFVMVCHSFGGALAAYYANRHPQRLSALVIIASAVRFHLRLGGRMLLRVPPSILTWLRQVLPYVGFNAARMYPPAHVIYLQNRNGIRTWDGSELLRAIKVPSLVVLGQRDNLFSDASYREVARLIPGAEQVVIPVSAHQVMVERPEAVNRAMERFLLTLSDPLRAAEAKAAQKAQRRAARKALEAQRPWLKFYDSRTPYRIRPPSVPLTRLLEATARRFAKTPAFNYLGRTMSWRELERQANRFAHGLLRLRVRSGERILLAMPNIPQWIIAYYGILKIGAVAVLADAHIDGVGLQRRIAESGSVMLITTTDRYEFWRDALTGDGDDDNQASLRRVIFASQMDYLGWYEKIKFALWRNLQEKHWLPWLRPGAKIRKHERRFLHFRQVMPPGLIFPPNVVPAMDDVAVLAYTSGGSGGAGGANQPLPVPLTHRNLTANALQLRHWLPESRPGDERFLAQQSFSNAYGLGSLLHLAVYLGATLILLPSGEPAPLLKAVKKLRPTFFPTTPRMVRLLTHIDDVRGYGLASIRVCVVSGASLPQETREEFEKITRGRLIEAYGLTEAAPAVMAMPVAAHRHAGGVCVPLPDTEAKIVDLDSGDEAALETAGELWVRGPQVFAGYGAGDEGAGSYERLTQERLRGGWLATGDIASMDEDGYFTLIDRKDNVVLRGGRRVYPRQIEEVLFEHPAVALAHVRREHGNEGQERLRATVVLHRNITATLEELLEYCAKRLHPSALPDSISIEAAQSALSDPGGVLNY
ncbi:MAG: alpha/beta fold hydrolase [Burkholderiaceae bacterium]|nr:alpha/beta fold hydrolase [Burkholderiaceae bacterium]